MPTHWRDWLPSGVFFAALAAFQLIWAFAAWSRPATLVLASGIAVNTGAAALWVTSCVVGSPVGPSAGQPEQVGAAGICVLLLQSYVVMGAAWAWSRRFQAREVSGFGRALVLMGANTIIAGAMAVGLVATLQGHHHHHRGGAAEAQGVHHATDEAHMEVTDMSLDTEGAHDHSPAATPPGDDAGQPDPDNPPAANPGVEDDGHQYHHDG